MIDDISESNFKALSTSSLSNVSIASRLDMKSKWFNSLYSNANRALAMGRSLEETYAFSGVHHIFDHHKGSGMSSFSTMSIYWLIFWFSCTCSICTERSKSISNMWSRWNRCDMSSSTHSSNNHLSFERPYGNNQWSIIFSNIKIK